MKRLKVYRGWLEEKEDRNGMDILRIKGSKTFALASEIDMGIFKYGQYLTVRYKISDLSWLESSHKEASKDKAMEEWVGPILGVGEAEHYARDFGFWDEKIEVGGLDLLEELRRYTGKYMQLEIEYSKTDFPGCQPIPLETPETPVPYMPVEASGPEGCSVLVTPLEIP